jgi:hypothetical protein
VDGQKRSAYATDDNGYRWNFRAHIPDPSLAPFSDTIGEILTHTTDKFGTEK